MKWFLLNTILISLTIVGLTYAELLIVGGGRAQPTIIDELPDPTESFGAVVLEGDFVAINNLPGEAPLYVVEKLYLEIDESGSDVIVQRIISLMHNFEHVKETKERARLNPNLILGTIHPASIRGIKQFFPDREIVEVMPDPSDTRRRAGNKTYKIETPS